MSKFGICLPRDIPIRVILGGGLLAFGLTACAAPRPAPLADPPPAAPPTQSAGNRDLYSDTWVATDGVGLTLPTSGAGAPEPRKDRFVGIFYFINHGSLGKLRGEPLETDDPRAFYDNTRVLTAMAGDRAHYHNYYKEQAAYFWGEPEAGYFLSDDAWVIRHDLAMLQAAGVDVLLFDVTNGPIFPLAYPVVCRVAEEMRKAGNPTPQIAFVTHSRGGYTANRLYEEFYSKNQYPDLWFRWQGKPLLLGDPAVLQDDGKPLPQAVKDFFTWRKCWAYSARPGRDGGWFGDGRDAWQWIDDWPQGYGWHDDPKKPEEIPVTIAGHPVESLGRSFHGTWNQGGSDPPLDKFDLAADTPKGDYFDQQWARALQVDPSFIFVTGWNEWTAFSYMQKPPIKAIMANRALQDGEYYFVDQYNEEFSRDAMPEKGLLGDNYYLQLAAYVRRYKGARAVPVAHGFHTLPPRAAFTAWDKITPEYRDAIGDTTHRDWSGWGNTPYKNTTGRNDIVAAKVACDAKNIYFYVRTKAPLTKVTDPNWMQLLIDADQDPKTGWSGYDFVVRANTLQRFSDNKKWSVTTRAAGTCLVIAIPRAALGLNDPKKTTFDFHWADNVPVGPGADIVSWWYDGDSAPDGRFNYRYVGTNP